MKIGDLVQLSKHYKNRHRWAIITDCVEHWGFCKIVFMDTGEEAEAIKSALIMYNDLEGE